MDIQWFSAGWALPKDLSLKDISLANSLRDKLRTCWVASHLCLSLGYIRMLMSTCEGPKSLAWYGKVLHQLAPNHVFNSCYYFLPRNLCSGIKFSNVPWRYQTNEHPCTFAHAVPFVWNVAQQTPVQPSEPGTNVTSFAKVGMKTCVYWPSLKSQAVLGDLHALFHVFLKQSCWCNIISIS